jgi:hypothetical protein
MRARSTAGRRAGMTVALIAGITVTLLTGASAQEFPFERELLLDATPMRGSKRIPGLEIGRNGQATIDLWCKSGRGQAIVAGDTITIIPGPMNAAPCSAEQGRGDEEMLASLTQITHWRRDGDVLVLVGPNPLRFRSGTN